MIRLLNVAAFLLIGCIGLHLPRSFTLLYGFAGIVIALVHLGGRGVSLKPIAWFHRPQLRSTILLALFALSYVIGMVWWGFWRWPADALDLVNALLLPGLMFFVGSQAAALSRIWSTRILLIYSLGGLVYGLAALAVARQPWWHLSQIFPSTIQVAWGSLVEINVRSVEQTAYPALLLIAPALCLLGAPASARQRRLGMGLLAVSALGAHVVWALDGRLAWLCLVLSLIPVFPLLCSRLIRVESLVRQKATLVAIGVCAAALGLTHRTLISGVVQANGIWAQGFCDERFSTFGAMLMRLYQAPWGGRLLRVPYSLCGEPFPTALLASTGGTISIVHNVVLEIYFSVGLLPVALFLVAIIPNVLAVFRGFGVTWSHWDWQVVLCWGWACFLACQWLFQPLLYSDGLLYYFSFFVLGLFSVQVVDGCLQKTELNQGVRLLEPQDNP